MLKSLIQELSDNAAMKALLIDVLDNEEEPPAVEWSLAVAMAAILAATSAKLLLKGAGSRRQGPAGILLPFIERRISERRASA